MMNVSICSGIIKLNIKFLPIYQISWHLYGVIFKIVRSRIYPGNRFVIMIHFTLILIFKRGGKKYPRKVFITARITLKIIRISRNFYIDCLIGLNDKSGSGLSHATCFDRIATIRLFISGIANSMEIIHYGQYITVFVFYHPRIRTKIIFSDSRT